MNQRNYNLGPNEEKETTITHVYGDKLVEIYTCEQPMITKLDKCVAGGSAVVVKEHKNSVGEVTGISYKLPLNCLSLRVSIPSGRTLTEEQKEAARERLKKAREERRI